MQVFQISFPIYAQDAKQAQELSARLFDFVDNKRKQGVAVSAEKLIRLLNKYENSYIVTLGLS